MAGVVEEIFKIDSNTDKILKELLALKGVYIELTDVQVEQVAELKKLEEAEKRILAARNRSTNPTAYIQLNKKLEETKTKIQGIEVEVDKFTAKSKNAALEADALGTSISNAFKGTQVNSIRNVAGSFGTLQNSVNQVSRELPAFAVSANTGFLAISNNLPILFDAFAKIKAENLELAKAGQKTTSVLSQLGGAIFSFGSILSIGVTLLTLYGGKIIEWVTELFEGEKALKSITTANDDYNKSISKTQDEIGKLIIKLKVQTGILTKGEGDLLQNENDRRKALEETNILRLKSIKALKEELGITDKMLANQGRTRTVVTQGGESREVAVLSSSDQKAIDRYKEGLERISMLNGTNSKYINEEYNLRGKLIKLEEDENGVKQRAVELEFLRQKSVADQIRQLQIESIKDEKERDIEMSIFKTEKAFQEIDEANRVEKEKLRISRINYQQRVAIEKSEAVRRGDSEKKINAQLSYLAKQHQKEIARIKADNIPEAEQFALREALADKLAKELQDIEVKYAKETNEKIAADFKLTYESRKAIIRENAEFEIYNDEETVKRLQTTRKIGSARVVNELKKQLLDKKIALIQANADEEKAETDNAVKKIEIQNRANIEIAKLKDKAADEDKKRRKDDLVNYISYFADIVKAAIAAAQQIIALKIKELDTQTSLQQKRVDEARGVADKGNAQQLALEQKRLDDLTKKRENYVRQQQALAAVELVANTAIAVSKAAAQGGVAAGVTIAAALIALVAGLATARSIAGQAAYYDGGFTGDGNPMDVSNTMGGRKASRNYTWHKGEFVFDHKNTRNYRDIFEDVHAGRVDLREWKMKASEYDLMQNYKSFMLNPNVTPAQRPVNIDMSGLERQMQNVNQSINQLSFGLEVDEDGWTMRQRKALQRKDQIRNNAKL